MKPPFWPFLFAIFFTLSGNGGLWAQNAIHQVHTSFGLLSPNIRPHFYRLQDFNYAMTYLTTPPAPTLNFDVQYRHKTNPKFEKIIGIAYRGNSASYIDTTAIHVDEELNQIPKEEQLRQTRFGMIGLNLGLGHQSRIMDIGKNTLMFSGQALVGGYFNTHTTSTYNLVINTGVTNQRSTPMQNAFYLEMQLRLGADFVITRPRDKATVVGVFVPISVGGRPGSNTGSNVHMGWLGASLGFYL